MKTTSMKSTASFRSSNKEFARFSKEMKRQAQKQVQEVVEQKEKDKRRRTLITIGCVAISSVAIFSFGQFITTQEFTALMQDLKDISIYIAILALIITLSVRS